MPRKRCVRAGSNISEAEHEQHAAAEHDRQRLPEPAGRRRSPTSSKPLRTRPQPLTSSAFSQSSSRLMPAAIPARISSRPPRPPGRGRRPGGRSTAVRVASASRRRPWPRWLSGSVDGIGVASMPAPSLGPRHRSRRRSGRLSVVPATILDGKATAAAIRTELTERVAALAAAGRRPGLGTLLVGDDPGSRWYVNAKHTRLRRGRHRQHPARAAGDRDAGRRRWRWSRSSTPTRRAPATSSSCRCRGQVDEYAVLEAMDPAKDADGLHPINLGRLVLNVPGPLPCTPVGIVELLRRYDVPIAGAEVVVIGRGITVGRPLGLLLTRRSENATVTLCHTGTRDLAAHVRTRRHRRRRGRRPGAGHRRAWSSRAPPSSTSASAGWTARSPATSPSTSLEVAGYVAPNPGGVGPDDPRDAAAERRRWPPSRPPRVEACQPA